MQLYACYPEDDKSPLNKNGLYRFGLGEGVLGKAATEQRIIYIPDTSNDTNFVNSVNRPNHSPKALICIPLLYDQQTFGVMNLSGPVGTVRFADEDIEFAQTIARLTVVSTKNIQMINIIEEQNRTLEQKVLDRTAALRQKTNDINSMLQNMQQGIFTILPGGVIHPEYSAHLETILETTNIADANYMDVLFSNTNLGADVIDQVSASVGALVGEDLMMFDFNEHLLVHELIKFMNSGAEKILDLSWHPIANDNDEIEKLMVTIRDVTELRSLQAKAEENKRELDIVGQILAVSKQKFSGFIKTSNQFIKENKDLIAQTNDKDTDVIATLFRNMHTVKGNARTYGFKYLTDSVHLTEQTYDELRHNNELAWDQELLLNELATTAKLVGEYESIFSTKLGEFAGDDGGVFVEQELLGYFQKAVENVNHSDLSSLQNCVKQIKTTVDAIGTEKITVTLDGIVAAMPALANDLNKIEPDVIIEDHDIRVSADAAPMLKDIFMHIFRNSMDHGIETPEKRSAAGKPEKGTITLKILLDANQLVFYFADDGKGLGLEIIHKKAISNEVIGKDEPITDDELAQFIFRSGISTAQEVTSVSGRGVGMDAVRRFLQKQGGNIDIQFTNPRDSDGFRPFQLVISLPGEVAIQLVH